MGLSVLFAPEDAVLALSVCLRESSAVKTLYDL